MTDEYNIILYEKNNNIYYVFTAYEISIIRRESSHVKSLGMIYYLLSNKQHYNDKIVYITNCNNSRIIPLPLRYIMYEYMNEYIKNFACRNNDFFYNKKYVEPYTTRKISCYYDLINKEYLIKMAKDSCMFDLIDFVKNSNKMKNYIKNELKYELQHYMLLNFGYARNVCYPNIPKGFVDSF
jgi:hypothetical protein